MDSGPNWPNAGLAEPFALGWFRDRGGDDQFDSGRRANYDQAGQGSDAAGDEPQAVSIVSGSGCQVRRQPRGIFCSTFLRYAHQDAPIKRFESRTDWALIAFRDRAIACWNLWVRSAAVLPGEAGADLRRGQRHQTPEPAGLPLALIERLGAVASLSSFPVFPSAAPQHPACQGAKRLQPQPVELPCCWRSVACSRGLVGHVPELKR